jgi:hypothetical protein
LRMPDISLILLEEEKFLNIINQQRMK